MSKSVSARDKLNHPTCDIHTGESRGLSNKERSNPSVSDAAISHFQGNTLRRPLQQGSQAVWSNKSQSRVQHRVVQSRLFPWAIKPQASTCDSRLKHQSFLFHHIPLPQTHTQKRNHEDNNSPTTTHRRAQYKLTTQSALAGMVRGSGSLRK